MCRTTNRLLQTYEPSSALGVVFVSCVVARHIPDGNMSGCHNTDRWVTLPENCQYDIIVSCIITFCSINFFRPLLYVQVLQVGVDLSAVSVRYGAIQRVRIKTSQLAASFQQRLNIYLVGHTDMPDLFTTSPTRKGFVQDS